MPLHQSSAATAVDDNGPQEPRTYAITGGRTRVAHVLHLETQLRTADTHVPLSPEAAQVMATCRARSVSVAEIAAAISRPVWAAKILIGDLLDAGALAIPRSASANPGCDPHVLRLVLNGLRQL